MRIRELDLSESAISKQHEELGLPPLETAVTYAGDSGRIVNGAIWLTGGLLLLLTSYLVIQLFSDGSSAAYDLLTETLNSKLFWSAVAVGLLAQIIDGALGMAYGVTSTTFLLASGVSPAVASASVHVAEVFTTGVSGIAHAKLGNVNKRLFLRLLIPGIAGAVTGAFILTSVDGNAIKPFISVYLLLMGLYIISKIYRKFSVMRSEPKHVAKLALFGGFVDAVGGGGWGPVVTTTLVGTGHDPRTTIGSVNFAEFFLTFASAITFATLVGFGPWVIVAGLVVGGLFSAPLAAYACRRLNVRTLLLLVGTLITLVSSYNLYKSLL